MEQLLLTKFISDVLFLPWEVKMSAVVSYRLHVYRERLGEFYYYPFVIFRISYLRCFSVNVIGHSVL